MFPSSAILEEMFPSDRDGNDIRRRYAISAIPGCKWRKGDVAAFSGVQMEIGVEDYIRDEVLRIIFCSCVTLDSGWGQWRSL